MLEYLKETGPCGDRFPTIFCPGCGIGQVLNYALNAVDDLVKEDGIPRDHFCFIAGIGCSARITSQPGDQLRIEAEVRAFRVTAARLEGKVYVGDKLVAEAIVTCRLVPRVMGSAGVASQEET